MTLRKGAVLLFYSTAALLIFLLTFRLNGVPIARGLDQTYIFAFNHLFANDFSAFPRILFLYGPLGFLSFPGPMGNNLTLAVLVHAVLGASLISALLVLNGIAKEGAGRFQRMIGIGVVFILVNFIFSRHKFVEHLLIVTVAVLILIHDRKRKTWWLYPALLIALLAAYVKTTYGILALLIFVPYSLLSILFNKDRKPIFLLLVGFPVLFIASWLILFGHGAGMLDYWRSSLDYSSGNSSTMTISPSNNWLLLGGCGALLLSIAYYHQLRSERGWFLLGLFALYLLAVFKYAFAREDAGHAWRFPECLLIILMLMLVNTKKIRVLAVVMMAVCVSLPVANLNRATPGGNDRFRFLACLIVPCGEIVASLGFQVLQSPQMKNWLGEEDATKYSKLWRETLYPRMALQKGFSGYRESLEQMTKRNLEPGVLSEGLRNRIGNERVDLYPNTSEVPWIPANDLNWTPRPVFQSYLAYTPWLDQKNMEFLLSQEAPRFILWSRDPRAIDVRYLPNDEPLTLITLLNRYRLVDSDTNIALLERSEVPRFKPGKIIEEGRFQWGDWIPVPPTTHGVLRANVEISRSLLGKLKKLLYKEEAVWIEYRLSDGRIRKHRAVTDNLPSGVWVNPFMASLFPRHPAGQVAAIRFSHSPADFFRPELEIQWWFYLSLEQ